MTAQAERKSAVTAAVVQMTSADDVARNLATVTERVAEAAARGATLITLPENFAYFGDEAGKLRAAETTTGADPGPITRTLLELAARHRVHLVGGGMPERSADAGRPYNCSLLVGPGGVLARYRKIHLFDVDLADGTRLEESRATHPGEVDQAVVADIQGSEGGREPAFTLGLSVCYDLRFPELYRAMSRAGARVLTVPAAFTVPTGKDHWHVLLRARAIENQCYLLAPAQHGTHPRGRQTYGKSLIVDPWGDVIAQASDGPGIALATLDFAYQDRVRAGLPALRHARL
jgi:predicted amidohydrolase